MTETATEILQRWAKGDTRPELDASQEKYNPPLVYQTSLNVKQKKALWDIARNHEIRAFGIHCKNIR